MEARAAKFSRNLKALNSQFKTWVEDQARNHAGELWSDGVEDYLTHAKKLLDEYRDVVDASKANAVLKLPPAAATFSFSATESRQPVGAPLFGSLSQPATTAALGGFGAGSTPELGLGTSTTFSFGGSTGSTFMFGAPAGGEGEEGDAEGEVAEEDEEETAAVIEAKDFDVVAKEKAKMREAVDKTWVDKGPGMLSVRRSHGPAPKPYCVFTADSGRVMLNAGLMKGQKINPGKSPRMWTTIMVEAGESGKPNSRVVIFQFNTDEAAAAMRKAIEDNAPA